MIERRGKILADLEKQSKSAQGNIKACMLKSIQVLKAMEPSMPLDERLYQDFTEAFLRLVNDPTPQPAPPIFMTLVDYMQERISVLSPKFAAVAAEHNIKVPASKAPEAAAAAPAAPAAQAAQAQSAKGPKDGFESSGPAKKKMSLGGDDAPPPPSASGDTKKKEELESFKAWMKNPSLGKTKG